MSKKITQTLALAIPLLLTWFLYSYTQTNFHTVLDGQVFRSAQLSAEKLKEKVTEHNIKTVINLRGPSPTDDWYIDEKKAAAELNIKHIDIKLASTDLNRVNRIKELIDIYHNQQKPILFHCNGGADRAGLASAIALLLENKLSLNEIETQFAWHYLVIKPMSTGKLFFDAYRQWLNTSKQKHSPAALNDWIDNHYRDDNGNRYYRIGRINTHNFHWTKDKFQNITLSRAKNAMVEISGTIMHYSGREKATKVEVLIDGQLVSNTLKSSVRPILKVDFDYHGFTQMDWHGLQDTSTLSDGCHDVQLRLTREQTRQWVSPPRARICITP
jgi:undecaprenyl-diphosphatase